MSAIVNPFAFGGGGGIVLPIEDDFNRADSSTTLNTSSSGHVWTPHVSTWGISNNQAYKPGLGADGLVTVDAGVSDCIIQVTLANIGDRPGLSFRFVDTNNYWKWYRIGGLGYVCIKVVGGTGTTMHTEVMSMANGDVLKVGLSGNSIELYVNGSLKTTLTDSAHLTATEYGLYDEIGNDPNARWETFSVTE